MTPRRWIEYLLAILAGNAIYFAVLHPYLPPAIRHEPYRVDVGLLIDFVCCVLVYAAIRLGTRHARQSRNSRPSPPLEPTAPSPREEGPTRRG